MFNFLIFLPFPLLVSNNKQASIQMKKNTYNSLNSAPGLRNSLILLQINIQI